MQNRLKLYGLLFVLFMIGIYWYDPVRNEDPAAILKKKEQIENIQGAELRPVVGQPEIRSNPRFAPPPSLMKIDDQEKISKYFSTAIKNMIQCLSINDQQSIESLEPSPEYLEDYFKSTSGPIISKSTQWSNIHLKLTNGEERRIRVELELNEQNIPVRKLKYFGLDKEGRPLPLDIPVEQQMNPNEQFLNALYNEGNIYLTENNVVLFYENGTQLSYIERNGKIMDFELQTDASGYKCVGLDTPQGSCRCFNEK